MTDRRPSRIDFLPAVLAALAMAGLMTALVLTTLDHRGIALLECQERGTSLESEIQGQYSVGQRVTCRENGFAGISVKFATFARINYGSCRLDVRDATAGGKLIDSSVFFIHGIGDNRFSFFPFPTQKSSLGRSYTITFVSEDAASGNALTIWYSNKDRFNLGTRLVMGNPVPGDLAFRLYRHLPVGELLTRVALNKPGFLAGFFLYPLVLLSALFFAILFLAILLNSLAKN
jgi:hypothetical protein